MNEQPVFSLSPVSPREGFLSQVLFVIEQRQKAARVWRIRISVSAGILSVAALIPVGISVVQAFAASHFGAYVSLIFSDTATVFSSWKEVGALLLESLPFAIVTLALGLFGVLAYSVRIAIRSISTTPLISHA